MHRKPMSIMVISLLLVMLVWGSCSSSTVFGKPRKARTMQECQRDFFGSKCCWEEWTEDDETYKVLSDIVRYCVTCVDTDGDGEGDDCGPAEKQRTVGGTFETQGKLPNGTIVPKGSGPAIPPGGGGVLETPSTPSTPPLKGGGVFNSAPPAPTDQGLQSSPALSNEAPAPPQTCPEGQELDEQTGLCVPIESGTSDDQSEESTQAPDQSTEEADGSENSNEGQDDNNN